jgi:SAM-dependent methyltransferase
MQGLQQAVDHARVGAQRVDDVNSRFYGRFPFPTTCMRFDYCADGAFDAMMLNQALGDWTHARIPRTADIWVAGCGTNQAIFVALRFPEARVIASDLSRESLDICDRAARQLGLSNLTLEQNSINRLAYHQRFDYVVCTGVIHHNAEPAGALAKLADALRPAGVLELMVYNRYHRVVPASFQSAVRILRQGAEPLDFDGELALARRLLEMPMEHALPSRLGTTLKEAPASSVADLLIQPVEFSYDVESLDALADACGLTILTPCMNTIDHGQGRLTWAIDFTDPELQRRYAALTDIHRWQLQPLLFLEHSPMLWFYLQRKDSSYVRQPERVIDESFLDQRFVQTNTIRKAYTRDREGRYAPARSFKYPSPPAEPALRTIWDAADGKRTMREIFGAHGISSAPVTVNRARILLTTPLAPHLSATTHA